MWVTFFAKEAKRGEKSQKARKKQKIGVKPANSVDKNAAWGSIILMSSKLNNRRFSAEKLRCITRREGKYPYALRADVIKGEIE